MKIRTKFVLPMTILVLVFALVTVFAINRTVEGLVASQEDASLNFARENLESKAEQRKFNIYTSIDQLGTKALELSSIFTEIPDVQTAYRLALLGDQNDENDHELQMAREHLRKVMAPYIAGYKRQTGQPSLQLHFHTPSARSLVRLWRDGWQVQRDGKKLDVSDDLSSFRKTVVEINQGDHKPIKGIEIGRGGFALRGLSPITSREGKHLGSCEVLIPFADVVSANHTDDSYQIAVYMLADFLPIAKKLQDPAKNPVLGGKYVFLSSTRPEETTPLLTAAVLDQGGQSEQHQVIDHHYVNVFPVNDYSGKIVGMMALVYNMNNIEQLSADIKAAGAATIGKLNWRFGSGAAVLVIIIFATVFLITRRVIGPLQGLVGAAHGVAVGDLSQTVAYRSTDEVGELATAINGMIDSLAAKAEEAGQIAQGNLQVDVLVGSERDRMGQAFRTMVSNLNEVLHDVAQVSQRIDVGSRQVSDTSQQMSQGASQSAASLEEIGSSMNQIGGQTQQSAENAGLAKELANGAQSAATTGSERMAEMISAMGEINAAGQNINKIIKVIDEIAFQTNLLALNAAVEAARAGQHGKGFAVVAEEVRNLAARSAKAAEETAQLIEGSVEKAANGTRIAEQTSAALDEIVASITRVTDLVTEIAAASNEQAEGISQINQGLGQIDQAVQHSTATAEESAAAAQELADLSAQLKDLLSRFVLARGVAASPAPSAPQPVLPKPQKQPEPSGDWAAVQRDSAKKIIRLDDEEFGRF
ncbi:methyl-accepting chemotaxis protein [Pelobacter seleniigenes]|uniref:methyl-accepting chemotaxis protein n=1 Tax=Pelobacter seleniigenes TaxID=407188 RepID=UPI0004A75D33|nr:methyl-accepting chemotaxis protein [Pelobacter seleniigenes]